ncbi:MAG: lysophospholipase [Actinobacteria bacterium]|nr:lysophospholipase [Actinomycetota bacterium]MBU1945171.1 lysophospholipase [Actinomycetota bacterium]MBU2687709.1 lysophospholipase [Actinomycetota bacterium]
MAEILEGKALALSFAGAGALYAGYVYAGIKTPEPGADQDVSAGLTEEKHEFVTGDGVRLFVKRYANPEGTPVIFFHGFNGNGFEFDLPRENKNFAVYLARRGYDVWVSSFRGCGQEPYISECDWRHSMDHLAIYDATAIVDGVITETGKKPFWIGHSMGGIVLYMYLQGVRFDGENIVVSDPALVEERNAKLLGGIPIASPPAFWWPRHHPFQMFTESSIGRGLLGASILATRARGRMSPRYPIGKGIKKLVGNRPKGIKLLARSPIGIMLYCRRNTDSDTSTSLVKWAGDDVSCKMYVQLVDGLWNINLRQYFPLVFRSEPYEYTMNMGLITAPMLFITGDKDFANYVGIRRYGFDRVSSENKKFVIFPGYGHTDLVMGKCVEEDVYPAVERWMRETEGAAG